MSQVTVTINARQYRMGCEEGEEEHLIALAREFDQRIAGMRKKFGEVGDMRLAIMAALTVADELRDVQAKMRALEQDVAALQESQRAAAASARATEAAIVAAFNSAAERIEKVTQALNRTPGNTGPPHG